MRRELVLVLLCVGVSVGAFAQDAPELWKWTADSDIGERRIAPNGDVLVASEKSIAVLSGATGNVVWSRDDMFHRDLWNWKPSHPLIGRDGKYEYLSFIDRYVRLESRAPGERPVKKFGRGVRIVNDRDDERLLLLHLDSGKDAFDSWASGIKSLRGTCLIKDGSLLLAWGGDDKGPPRAVAFDLAAAKVAWTTQLPMLKELLCHRVDPDLWVVFGRTEKGQHRVASIASANGQMRWESADLGKYESDGALVTFTDDEVALLYAEKNDPVAIDIRNGSMKWRTPVGKGVPARIVRKDDRVFVVNDKGLVALDVASGAVKWRLDQSTRIVDMIDGGLLVRSGGLRLLRYEDGKPVWPSPVTGNSSVQLLRDNTLLHVDSSTLRSLDVQTGSSREIGSVEFQGAESPGEMELVGDLVVVSSSQNVAAFDSQGERKYQTYYPAPGLSRTQKILAQAVAEGMTSLSRAAAYQQARANARDVAFIRGGSGTGVAFYRVYNANLDVRFQATTDADRYIYMFTERPDASGRQGFSFVRIDKTSGSESGRVWSKDRNPAAAADAASQRIFIKTSDNELTAYGFTRPN